MLVLRTPTVGLAMELYRNLLSWVSPQVTCNDFSTGSGITPKMSKYNKDGIYANVAYVDGGIP